jgi:subfamily B ATP-binding cassette protein MsbA
MNRILVLLKNAGIGPGIFALPIFWSVIASLFDGVSIGLFVPILKGISEGNYQFLAEYPYLGPILTHPALVGPEVGLIRPLMILGFVWGVLFSAKLVSNYFASMQFANCAYDLAHRLRQRSFSRSISLGKAFFDSTASGQLHTIITQFSAELSWRLSALLQQFSYLLPIVFYIGIMFLISWKAALVSLILAPAILLIRPIYRRLTPLSIKLADDHRSISNLLDRVLRGIVIVKANSGEEAEIEQFRLASEETFQSGVSYAQRQVLSNLLLRLLMLATLGFCGLIFLALLKNDIKANASAYLVYLVIIKRCLDVLQQGSQLYGDCKGLAGVVDSINEVFNVPLDRYQLKDGTIEFTGLREQIEVRDLNFSYQTQRTTLTDINFTISRGEVVALVGPSGSGKSTLAQLLLRLYDAPPNTILLDGVDIREYTLASLRQRTAYVSQTSNLFDDTLRNNLLYGCCRQVSDTEIATALSRARLSDFMETLPEGLNTRIGDRGTRISGGEAQRVAIARAILKGVDFFILDEATSALDASTEKQVQEAIDDLVKDKTVLVIAHRFSTLKNVDKIITIANGQLVEQGSLNELLASKGLFSQLWKAQELFV